MPQPPLMSIAATLAAHRKNSDKPKKAQAAGGAQQTTSTGSSHNQTHIQLFPSTVASITSSTPLSVPPPKPQQTRAQELHDYSPNPSLSSASGSIKKNLSASFVQLLPIFQDQVVSDATGTQINACQYNSTGEYILTGGVDRTVRLWNPDTRFCIKSYEAHGWEVLDLAISPENGKFASCGGDKTVFLWDVMSGMTIRRFTGHTQRVNTVDFNDEGTVLVSGSYDATIRLWDCRSNLRAPIQILEEPKDSVTSIELKGSDLLAGCVDGSIRIYDIRKGSLITDQIFEPITSVAFSSDGNCVLASSLDDTVRLMDRDNGTLLNAYKGHKNNQYKIRSCLDNSDAHVISGSEDGKIFIWDLMEGAIIHEIDAHSKIVSAIAYHPTQDRMCSASVDGSIKTWTSQPATA
ncbi:WD repeat-containing protein 83 [Lobosporangium transversale]|uniref:WD40-repeat-containing domain protein n=1 Tax=Lobosporangium transversale TaxID=64571 RepID=A0A1Y2GZK1_9FUNG|nr:WD40-repeat-containing domain protein [Lobosporangium transversale]KAF9918987.1 WD repeat-containing protein 83 [Lobosporangium transversale]ORZ27729.1 WD40-repeat-containing domain protein [Lobosporangium transversale]|eukprot:XP_021885432.1 WD40-repeat-containing domain protein [Lobosporangium transversale]